MYCQGPAEYELVSISQTKLNSGLLSATVPPGSEGFEVTTPTARVVDLGTAFGVQLSDSGSSNVTVFDGESMSIKDVWSDSRMTAFPLEQI